MKKTLLLFFMALLCNVVKAQFPYNENERLRFGIQIGADYDVPLGKLRFLYQPAIVPNINPLRFSKTSFHES
ncbi:hypothetical protein [Pedobacter aquatilis]|uniref:hypothetical protein n=1 Tax=Pedobacter aquatilis TaxID=351343 RepID=UPI00292DA92F|nr:hypothetical protein [Pedobacter aquatilis]